MQRLPETVWKSILGVLFLFLETFDNTYCKDIKKETYIMLFKKCLLAAVSAIIFSAVLTCHSYAMDSMDLSNGLSMDRQGLSMNASLTDPEMDIGASGNGMELPIPGSNAFSDISIMGYDPETGMVTLPMSALSEDTQNALMATYTQDQSASGSGTFNPDSQEYREQLMESIATAAMSDKRMNFSEAFNAAVEGFQMDTSKVYDSVSAAADFGLVNARYSAAWDKLADFSSEYSSQIDYAGNGISLFQDTYGDMLSNVDMSGYKIPEGFDPAASARSLGDSFSAAYGSNDKINSIASSINISAVFHSASQPMSMPSLQSYGNLQGMLSDISGSLKANSNAQYASDMASVQSTSNIDALRNNLSGIMSNVSALQAQTGSAFASNQNNYGSFNQGSLFDHVLDGIKNIKPVEGADGKEGSYISGFDAPNGAGTLNVTPFDGVNIDGLSWIDNSEMIYTGYDGVKGSVIAGEGATETTLTDEQVMSLAQVRVPITEIAPYIVDGTFTFADPDSEEAQYYTAISQQIVDENLTINTGGYLVAKED